MAYKRESEEKTHDILTSKQTIISVDSKTWLGNLMNQKVAMFILEMHPKGKDKILIHLKIEDINLSQIFTMCLRRKIIYQVYINS